MPAKPTNTVNKNDKDNPGNGNTNLNDEIVNDKLRVNDLTIRGEDLVEP